MGTARRGLGQMSPNGTRHVCYGVAGETAEFDDFRDNRSATKWNTCGSIRQVRAEGEADGFDETRRHSDKDESLFA
eukprot:scaffold6776_cov37-Cyclotella_meneghiniana.AAC.10